jgi:two-component system CheB/CheR fusion protein
VGISDGKLRLLLRRNDARGAHLPIDFFLGALAKDHGSKAIGVILSGTASDGTEGLRAIKAADGITLAQDPRSAKFGGMPRSAIEAGVVDHCLAIPELAHELLRLSHHPYVAAAPAVMEKDASTLAKVFAELRKAVGVDFTEYKSTTIERRIARRMALSRAPDLSAYLRILEGDPEEARSLYEDVLIHVTSFFRDPAVFESLKTRVFPEILKHKSEGSPIRIWVAGCSTGEEVYSLAISLLEFLQDVGGSHPIQIFGSDVSEKAIERARAGIFPDSVLPDLGSERRKRFFDQGRKRLPDQQGGAGSVRVRSARSGPRSALFEAGSRQLSQRAHLFRPAVAKAGHSHVSLLPEPTGIPAPRPHRGHLRLQPAVLAGGQGQQDLPAQRRA